MNIRLLLLFILSVHFVQCKQDKVNYNLDFKNIDLQDFKWRYTFIPFVRIDSTENKIGNKYPLCFEQSAMPVFANILKPFRLELSQQLFIPKECKFSDSIGVSIYNKCYNLSEAQLKLFCLDTNDKLVYVDSIDINNDSCWTQKSISFPVAKTGKMLLGIYALGWDYPSLKVRDVQKLCIDRISVTINNCSIKNYNYLPIQEETKLDNEKTIILTPENYNSFANIPIPKNKKIIGIGESMHGSKTINNLEVEYLKYLIENERCRLLLVEANLYEMLLANLYIQGQTPDDYHQSLLEVSSFSLFSSDVFCDFMSWLRQYNQNTPASDKVRICGLLNLDYNPYIAPLFDYLYAFYNKKNRVTLNPLLELLYDRKLDKALDLCSASNELKQILGSDNYSDFVQSLTNASLHLQHNPENLNTSFHKMASRDYSMFETAQQYISKYTKEEDKVCVVAHNAHVSKQGNWEFPYINSLGYYLNNYYENACYSAGIFVGKGNLLSSISLNDEQKFEKEKLDSFPNGSIEYLCSKTAIPLFYYSTNDLDTGNFFYRNIGNSYMKSSACWYGNLKSNLDGLFFISESQAGEKPIVESEFNFTIDKIREHASILHPKKND